MADHIFDRDNALAPFDTARSRRASHLVQSIRRYHDDTRARFYQAFDTSCGHAPRARHEHGLAIQANE